MRYAVVTVSVLLGLLLAFELWITLGSMQPGAGLGIVWLLPAIGIQAVTTLLLLGLTAVSWKSLPSGLRLTGGLVLLFSLLWVPFLYGLMAAFE